MMQKSGFTKRYIAEMTLIRMGDESLDMSVEAITSRISKLETRVTMTNVTPQQPVLKTSEVSKPSTSESAQPPHKKAEIDKKVPDVKTEPQKRTEKLIRGWAEIVESITLANPGQSSFLKTSKAYLSDDGSISIKFKNKFGMQMFEEAGHKPLLCSMLGETLRREINENDIKFVVSVSDTEDVDDLDELTEQI